MEYKETFLQDGKTSKIILNFLNKNWNIISSSINQSYSYAKRFSTAEYNQPFLTAKSRNGAFNSVKLPDMLVCHRSAGWSQDHIRPDRRPYGIYDVTCVTGCIFGVSDVQLGCLWPSLAIQGPSGTVKRRFLQNQSREGQLQLRNVSSMIKGLFLNRLFGMSWFGGGCVLLCERHVISSVLFSVIT